MDLRGSPPSAKEVLEVERGIFRARVEARDAAPRVGHAALHAETDVATTAAPGDDVGQDGPGAAVGALVEQHVVAAEAALLQLVLVGIELALREWQAQSVARPAREG